MALISESMPYVLENEGGLTRDDGGLTNLGLTKPDLAAYRHVHISQISDQDIEELTNEAATKIYYELYWKKLNLDQIWDPNKATAIFDVGVNRGVSIGAKYAQKSASLCGRPDNVDGILGGISIACINAVDRSCFVRHMEGLVWAGYQAIVARDPSKYGRYLRGWETRCKRLLTLA